MKNLLLLGLMFALVTLTAAPLSATTITFSVNPALLGQNIISAIDFHSSALNGTVFNGQQPVSIDAILGDGVLARMFVEPSRPVALMLTIQTSTQGFPGFLLAGTGYLLNPADQQLGSPQQLGRSASSTGETSAEILVALVDSGGSYASDITGAHFDTGLPFGGATVTDVILTIAPMDNRFVMGTATQLPEMPSLVLLPLGLIGLGIVGSRTGSRFSQTQSRSPNFTRDHSV